MDFILFHHRGKPNLIRTDSIMMVRAPLKGEKYLIVTSNDESIEVDESFKDIADSLQEMDLEVVEVAND